MRGNMSKLVRIPFNGFFLFAAIYGLMSLPCYAQNVVTGQSRDDLELPKPETNRFSDESVVEEPKENKAQPCPFDGSDLTLSLSGIVYVFSDGTPLTDDILKTLSSIEYTKEESNITLICNIRDQANSALQRDGWIALARIPQQDLVDRLKLEITSARITDVGVIGEIGPNAKIIANHLKPLRLSSVLNRNETDQALLRINEIPGLGVRLQIAPIKNRPGELAGNLFGQYRPYSVILNTRNLASQVNGRESVLARFEFYGLTKSADLTYISAQSDWGFEHQQILQAGHEFGVGRKGLRFGADLTYSETRPDIEGLELDSRALLIGINARYPIVTEPRRFVDIELGFDYSDLTTDIITTPFSEDALRTIYLRTGWAGRGSRGSGYRPWSYQGTLELRKGLNIFSATNSGVEGASTTNGLLASRPFGQSDALVFTGGADVLIPIGKIFGARKRIEGQWTEDPLLSLDEFSAGNFTIGRGFDPGTINGDRAFGGQFELSALPFRNNQSSKTLRRTELFGFYDWIDTRTLDPLTDNPSQSLDSVGAGIRTTV